MCRQTTTFIYFLFFLVIDFFKNGGISTLKPFPLNYAVFIQCSLLPPCFKFTFHAQDYDYFLFIDQVF